jgi:predicted phosphoribosyltransferase
MIDDSDLKQQMTIVENGVNYNIKRYNDLRVLNERLTMNLKAQLDELDDQRNSYEELRAMKNVRQQKIISGKVFFLLLILFFYLFFT